MVPAKQVYEEIKKKMEQSRKALAKRYTTMRGGRARADLISEIKVDCYGSKLPINQLSTISVPEPRLIVVEPWDKSLTENIKKAILAANIGINPSDDGNFIRLSLSPLTEERREEIVKFVKQWAEEAKVSIRNLRREAREKIEEIKKNKDISEDEEKRAEKDIQILTNEFMSKIEELQEKKAEEIRTV